MREIEYKVWVKKLKRMAHVVHIDFLHDSILFFCSEGKRIFKRVDFKGAELLLCTGVIDKNGTKIYEGDIIKFIFEDRSYFCTVTWNEFRAAFEAGKDNVIPAPLGSFRLICEIVGNKFENPELAENVNVRS